MNTLVLPAPFGPMIAVMRPGAAAKLTPRKAWMPPKLKSTASTASARPAAAGVDSMSAGPLVFIRVQPEIAIGGSRPAARRKRLEWK